MEEHRKVAELDRVAADLIASEKKIFQTPIHGQGGWNLLNFVVRKKELLKDLQIEIRNHLNLVESHCQNDERW